MSYAPAWIHGPAGGASVRGAPIAGLAAALTVMRNLTGVGARTRAAGARALRIGLADGRSIPVHVQGDGPAVVLVHGLGGSHRDWDRLAVALAGRCRVVRYDAIGHGARAHEAVDRVDLVRLAAELAAVIDGLGLERALLVGHSMGAMTVMQYLQDHGDARVGGVCLLDQSPRIVTDAQWCCGLFGEHSADRHSALLARLKADFAGTVLEEVAGALPGGLRAALGHDGWARRVACRALGALRSAPLLSLLESLGAADFRALAPRLSVPVMVVLGARSHHYGGVPLDAWYRRTLANGRVLRYDASAHSPHRQEAARLAGDLVAFASACVTNCRVRVGAPVAPVGAMR